MVKGLAFGALVAFSATAAHAEAKGGPRIEAHLGWDQHGITSLLSDSNVSYVNARSSDGFTYGGEVGYDLPLGNVTIGVYAGANLSSAGECEPIAVVNEMCITSGRSFYGGVRVGYQLSDGILAYAKGGYSNGRITTSYKDVVTPANGGAAHDDFSGYHVGGGVQVDLSAAVYAKLEYLHTNYQDYEERGGTAVFGTRVDRNTLLYGMGLRF